MQSTTSNPELNNYCQSVNHDQSFRNINLHKTFFQSINIKQILNCIEY